MSNGNGIIEVIFFFACFFFNLVLATTNARCKIKHEMCCEKKLGSGIPPYSRFVLLRKTRRTERTKIKKSITVLYLPPCVAVSSHLIQDHCMAVKKKSNKV